MSFYLMNVHIYFDRCLILNFENSGDKEDVEKDRIVHEGMLDGHDKSYMASIIQSKSLSSDLHFNSQDGK